MPRHVFRRRSVRRAQQLLLQRIEPRAGRRAHRHDRRAFQKRSAHELLDFQPHQPQHVGVDQIGFRERDESARNSQQPANVEMLARLRLDRFVGRDHQQHHIDSARARQHVAHEALVSRHIDESQSHVLEIQERKAQIDRDSAPLFFFEAVGIGARQRLNQRRFSVVDVPGGSDDDVLAPPIARLCPVADVVAIPACRD